MSERNETPAESKTDVERYLDGEITVGRLIHNRSLEYCWTQAADLIGVLVNVLSERHRAERAELEKEVQRLNRLMRSVRQSANDSALNFRKSEVKRIEAERERDRLRVSQAGIEK